MNTRASLITMLRQNKKATTTTRGKPRRHMLNGEWAEHRRASLNAAPYERVEAAVLASIRRKSALKRDAIMR